MSVLIVNFQIKYQKVFNLLHSFLGSIPRSAILSVLIGAPVFFLNMGQSSKIPNNASSGTVINNPLIDTHRVGVSLNAKAGKEVVEGPIIWLAVSGSVPITSILEP